MPMESQAVHELLQKGIAAAKGGQPTQAKTLLTQVLRQDARNVQAWLWLAGIASDPIEQETYLQRVLSIDPHNAIAQQGLSKIYPRATQQLLKQGIVAVQSGDLLKARDLLVQVTDRDENQASAWLWLSQVVEDQEERIVCLENVLALEPGNMEAQTQLLRLSLQPEVTFGDDLLEGVSPDETSFDETPSGEGTFDTSAYDAFIFDEAPEGSAPSNETAFPFADSGATLDSSDIYRGYEMVGDEPASAAIGAWDRVWEKYRNVHSCPYCATPAEESQRRCSACGRSLWRREPRSMSLWVVMAFAVLAALLWTFLAIGYLFLDASEFIAYASTMEFLSSYTSAVIEQLYRLAQIGLIVLSLFSWMKLVALFVRWTPVWYWYLIANILGLGVTSIRMFASGEGFVATLIAEALLLVIYGVVFLLVFAMRVDFVKSRVRILLKLDAGISDGEDYLDRGEDYARKGMWALAAVHFLQATDILNKDPESYRVTIVAGLKLRDGMLARYALERFKVLAPDTPKLAELTTLVAGMK